MPVLLASVGGAAGRTGGRSLRSLAGRSVARRPDSVERGGGVLERSFYGRSIRLRVGRWPYSADHSGFAGRLKAAYSMRSVLAYRLDDSACALFGCCVLLAVWRPIGCALFGCCEFIRGRASLAGRLFAGPYFAGRCWGCVPPFTFCAVRGDCLRPAGGVCHLSCGSAIRTWTGSPVVEVLPYDSAKSLWLTAILTNERLLPVNRRRRRRGARSSQPQHRAATRSVRTRLRGRPPPATLPVRGLPQAFGR